MRVRPGAVAPLLGVVVAAAVVVAAPQAGAVTTRQSYAPPANGQVVVRGHGFGHGHGMSQYGAEGAALQGLDYRRIVGFYYPGTSWSQFNGRVRVLISADTTPDVVVSPAAGLTVRDLGTGTTYPLPAIPGVTRWRLNVGAGNATVVGYLTDRWHRWLPGGKAALTGDGEFFAHGPLTLWTPSGPRHYRGTLRAASPTPGSADRDTVNVLSMDAYLQGVVPREMPASWQPEAVKAQAVAARTYAAWSLAQHRTRYYQICDTTACQVYGGEDAEDPRSNAAVVATAHQILTYAGTAAFTQFSASDGGWTAAGGMPYLPAPRDPYDGYQGNPVHDWSLTVDAGRLERAYPAIGTLQGIDVVSRDGHGDWQGRVGSMVLRGTQGSRTISGDSFQYLYGLRSTWFTLGDAAPAVTSATPTGTSATSSRSSFGLSGAILATYQRLGGSHSRLGPPTTGVQQIWHGQRAKFRNGVIWSHRGTGTVAVVRWAIVRRYFRAQGVRSKLGWPTRGNTRTPYGEKVTFQHGVITWDARTHRTGLQLTR